MKFFISELFTAAEIKLGNLLETLMIGSVCIVAILKCGIWALAIIGLIRLFEIGAKI